MKSKKVKKSDLSSNEVELVVTQKEYEAGLKRGWTDDDMLKPGRYKFKRGGFLTRHPELKIKREEASMTVKGQTLQEWAGTSIP